MRHGGIILIHCIPETRPYPSKTEYKIGRFIPVILSKSNVFCLFLFFSPNIALVSFMTTLVHYFWGVEKSCCCWGNIDSITL